MAKIIKKTSRASNCCKNCLSFDNTKISKQSIGCCFYKVDEVIDPWDICSHFRFKCCKYCEHFFDNPVIIKDFGKTSPICIIVNDIKDVQPYFSACDKFEKRDEDD